MNKIYFKNSTDWKTVSATLFNKNEKNRRKIHLTEHCENGDLVLDFDNEQFDHLCFEGGVGKRTGKIYPGNLSIGVEYKRNENMNKNLTYLFAKDAEKTGRVDNFVLEDAQNLAYRDDKSKKISVFVPSSYDGKTPHDILYFFDAQNLFCEAGHYTDNGDPYGSWQLDTVLTQLHAQYGKNVIVVGIDNADKYRSNELFMNSEEFGALSLLATAIPEDDFSRGYLDGLADFMKDTLHPFIKERYCVSEENIGIGGSSMGGIASFYCGLRDEEFYGYVLSYSPAYGLYEMSAFKNWFKKKSFASCKKLPKIHIYCGRGDLLEAQLIPSSKRMKSVLIKHGYPAERIFETYDSGKPHNEESWRLILPQSFEYLH